MVTDGEMIIYRSGGTRTVRSMRLHHGNAASSFGVRSSFGEDRIRRLESRVAVLEQRLAELTERLRPGDEPEDGMATGPRKPASFPGELKVVLYSGQGATAVVGPARIHMDEGEQTAGADR